MIGSLSPDVRDMVIRKILPENQFVFISLARKPPLVLDCTLSSTDWERIFRTLFRHVGYAPNDELFTRIRLTIERNAETAIQQMEDRHG